MKSSETHVERGVDRRMMERRVNPHRRVGERRAVDRTRAMAEGATFILPVCIDETPESSALVSEKFLRNHWTRMPGGEPPFEFVERLRQLLGHSN